ncbi:hypothetical protein [Slackia sp.]|uniref:hypothetical protein n=1 Tax=Slackia sp. TaxID=2049041 RepID=UPI00262331A6|nr:hypothetical protein [Slackia sp.]
MSTPIDHIAYLSQEIGPRPAGTEEEQQAALYITERFQKESHLPVEIEDFTCNANPLMPKLICYAVTIVATILALFVPILAVPAVVAAVLSAAIYIAESFDKPVLSQLFMKGVSQNVVAKYEPANDSDGSGTRRRKVILVANYDSGKVRHDLSSFLVGFQKPLQYTVMGSMCLIPLILLVRQVLFNGEGIAGTVLMALSLILAVVVAVPAVFSIMEKTAAYNEGANANAAGVAVMLEVARRISDGEATSEPSGEGVMHGEEEAYAAGVVPDGATISYEYGTSDGRRVERVHDASGDLAQAKENQVGGSAIDEEMPQSRKEGRSVSSSTPVDTLAAAAAKAAELHEAAQAAEAAERARKEAEELAAAYELEQERIREEERAKALEEAAKKPAPNVPDWYLKATEKARKNYPQNLVASDSSYRSRYAVRPEEPQVVGIEEAPEEPVGEIEEIPGSAAPVPYVEDFVESPAFSDGDQPAIQEEELSENVVDPSGKADSQEESAQSVEDASDEPQRDSSAEEDTQENADVAEDNETLVVEEVSQADATAPIVEEPSDSFDFGDDGRDAMGVMSVDAFLEEETSVQDAQGGKQGEKPQELPVLDFSNMGRTAAMPPVKGVGQDDESVAFVEADGSCTTAMPAVSDAGNLDLDALRMAAEGLDSGSEAVRVSDSPAAVNPQAMYYNPPEDRSEELRDRARKERAVVTLTADEMEDMTVSVSEAEPMASAAQVVSVASSRISGSAVASEDAGLPRQEETAETSGDSSALGAVQEPVSVASEATAALPVVGGIGSKNEPSVMEAERRIPSIPAIDQAPGRVVTPRIPKVDLPSIVLPSVSAPEPKPISFDDLRQRAPLASVAESNGQEAAKNLLSTTLPSIEDEPSADRGEAATKSQTQNNSVSMTGSFAAIGAIGAEPVGDELLENVDPDDIYVDDADDSVFEEEFTETGAFAGPGYVEMPQSRVGKFFGKFRRKKEKKEESAHEWLGVDEDFDARSAGKARGSWESFREDDEWQGGAFGGFKARLPRKEQEEDGSDAARSSGYRQGVPAVSSDAFAAALAAANAAAEASGNPVVPEDVHQSHEEDIQEIYSFAAGDINTEVWFVALGSDLAGNGGIKAFLADHASDMRGAVIVNLEALGAGSLSYLEREGAIKQVSCSPRMKRFIRKASQASGVDIHAERVDWRESPASYAQKHRMQAMTLVGMDGKKPAYYAEADDILENIDAEALNRSANVVVELLKNI